MNSYLITYYITCKSALLKCLLLLFAFYYLNLSGLIYKTILRSVDIFYNFGNAHEANAFCGNTKVTSSFLVQSIPLCLVSSFNSCGVTEITLIFLCLWARKYITKAMNSTMMAEPMSALRIVKVCTDRRCNSL